jgi:predicted nucleic acid-binding protein
MSYLLDTCIISKLRKIKNESHHPLQDWILSHSETSYFLSVLTIGEIQAGISKLDAHDKKKIVFEDWLLSELIPRFKDRILYFDDHTASIWGTMRGEVLKHGINLPVIDSLIAATAIQHNLILVTENIKDFTKTGARLLNPLQP